MFQTVTQSVKQTVVFSLTIGLIGRGFASNKFCGSIDDRDLGTLTYI